ncbi:nmrA-like family protein [Dactylonectria estremocensis]|uniref:NmrA-like family protein n=1 Tax=Dactylonectria estremocensis TaxID=1079267 RepID=A0A9P9ETJ7_9HYPO|nr:nmrA-like family protein [Dactylonectria estremocensis]
MVNVAIAGGTGVMGKTLADVLARQTTHQALILTRKFVVDYSDVASLTSFLQEHQIHTVISAFGINATSLAISQINLIKAAEASSATKRFIPSSFAIDYPRAGPAILPPLQSYFDSLDALEKTSLEWAVVNNGTFLDYYAPPTLKSHYKHGTVVLDIPNAAAGIPGTGDEPQTFTYTFDVARFTIAALDLPSWPRQLRIVGDTLTYNEFVKLAEAARGVKFDVKYDDLEKLRRFEITELPGHLEDYKGFPKHVLLPFLSIFQRWMAEGHGFVPKEGSLNEKFPEIETLTATKLMDQYWTR